MQKDGVEATRTPKDAPADRAHTDPDRFFLENFLPSSRQRL